MVRVSPDEANIATGHLREHGESADVTAVNEPLDSGLVEPLEGRAHRVGVSMELASDS